MEKNYKKIFTIDIGGFLRQLKRNLNNTQIKEYCFATGYFDFKTLGLYFDSFKFAIEKNAKVRFLISNKINTKEFLIIKNGREGSFKKYIELFSYDDLNMEQKKGLFEWLNKGMIEFKVVYQEKGMFHGKFGYIEQKDNIFSWQGSANHTKNGLSGINTEQISYSGGSDVSTKNLFNKIWNGDLEDSIIINIDNLLVSEIAINILKSKDELFPILKRKWKKFVFLWKGNDSEEDQVYLFNDEGIFGTYELPSGYFDILDDKKTAVIEKDKLNKINMYKWINSEESDDYFISQNLRNYVENNVINLLQKTKEGRKIKNDWNSVIKSDDFKNFKNIMKPLKRMPFELQNKQAYFAAKLKKTMNFSVPGTGKTMVSLMAFHYLREKGEVNKLFVIGPTSSHEPWIYEYYETFGENPSYLNLSKIKCNSDQKVRKILNAKNKFHDLIIMHFSTAYQYTNELKHLIDEKTFFIIDEAHYIKNENGSWGIKITEDLGKKSSYSLLLTGTPAPNGIQDIHNMLRITYGEEFLQFYQSYENQNELITGLHMKVTYEDLEMPFKQINHFVNCKLNMEQISIINSIKEDYAIATYEEKLALLVKWRQVLSSPKLIGEEEVTFENSSKIKPRKIFFIEDSPKLEELIKLINPNKNIVIWSNFISSIHSIYNEIKRTFPEVNVYKYYGEKNSDERESILKKYKKDGGILLANPQTLAESVSLHRETDYTIYFEYDFNLISWQQSRNRTFRYGIKNDMHYYILYSEKDFLNKKILDALKRKSERQYELINAESENMEEMILEAIDEFIRGVT